MKADIILKGKNIFDGKNMKIFSGMVAIADHKIIYVGEEKQEVGLVDEHTQIIDVEEQLIMPGIGDAHIHFYMSGLYASPFVHVSFTDESEQECVDGLKELSKTIAKDRWLIGAGWYHPLWKNPVLPTKKSLDAVYPDRPVCMVSADCHTMWINSIGLEKLGLNKESTAPEGGSYDYLEDGELAGTIHEAAASSLIQQIYQFTESEENAFYHNFIKKLNQYGITSVCDMSMMPVDGADFIRDDIFTRLLEQGELSIRVNMYPTLRMDNCRIKEMQEKYTGTKLRCQGGKQFFDGVSSCHTAFLKEPYTNAYFEGDCGKTTIPPDEMKSLILNAVKEEIPARIHAIGDQAIHLLIDYFEEAYSIYGKSNHSTIEHLENFQSDDLQRLADVGVIPSVQPPHLAIDPNGEERDLGMERIHYMWPFRTMIDLGMQPAFGTDSPVVDINPFEGIYNAVTRRSAFTKEPKEGWVPTEKITILEALKAYTYGSAMAANREEELGSLEIGKLADVIVLDKNIVKLDSEEILQTKVVLTIVDGKVIYKK